MWYQKVDKQQLTLYARLEARLNKVYWLSTLHETASERKQHTPDLRRKLASAEKEIEQLLSSVNHDMKSLSGKCGELINIAFNYIESYSISSISSSNSKLLCGRIGIDRKAQSVSEMNNEVELEKIYVNRRAALIDEDDLDMIFDKAICIIYEMLGGNVSTDTQGHSPEERLATQFVTAKNFLKHNLSSLRQCCGDYTKHLELQEDQKREFAVALTNDYKELFDTGMTMLTCATHLTAHRHGIKNMFAENPQSPSNFKDYQRKIERMHSRLITVNLMRCETILNALNTCTVK